MSESLSFHPQQMNQNFAHLPWLSTLLNHAWNDLHEFGFPNRHHEEWKYTRTDTFLKQGFTPSSKLAIDNKHTDLPLEQLIYIDNGQVIITDRLRASLPSGVIVESLVSALEKHPQLVESHLGKILKQEHAFHFLNTMMLDTGVFIYVPEHIKISAPFAVIHRQDQINQAVYIRHLIILESGSEIHLVEDYQGLENLSYSSNSVTEIVLGTNSQLDHYKIQRESKKAYHFGHIAIQQMEHSVFNAHSLNLGAHWCRSDLSIYLAKENAQCLMNGIYAPMDGQHVDHHTTVFHEVPNCKSEQDYKGILNGASKAVFNGKVIVAPNAQHSNAQQQNKNLLLSAQAEVDTKPQLEISADDVVCSHGATVGQLDEEALFFMATRGIDKINATYYLIHAFMQANLQKIPSTSLAKFMEQLLNQHLG